MRLTRPIGLDRLLLLTLLFAAHKVCAQLAPADDFFNSGAQFYISNNIPAALKKTESGLQLYPDNVKLKKLEELLKQQQKSQSQQNKQQQKNKQNQQNQSQQQQQKSQSQQKNQQQQDQQSQQNKQQQNKSDQQKDEEQQASAAQGKEMTPEEAKKLLDAQKGDEQILQMKPEVKPEDQNRTVKDW